jgi:hypothetical protein
LTYFLPHFGHVLLHRLWAFATLQDDLSLAEHAHILDCDDCRNSLRVCLTAENFGGVLVALERTDDRPDPQITLW